jgi:hypothetical protein
MRSITPALVTLSLLVLLGPSASFAQVLGPCGTKDAQKPAAAVNPAPAGQAQAGFNLARLPLPGEQAPNFELDAVVGKKVKKVKLSDYDGKWRVICFYPADFTFV